MAPFFTLWVAATDVTATALQANIEALPGVERVEVMDEED